MRPHEAKSVSLPEELVWTGTERSFQMSTWSDGESHESPLPSKLKEYSDKRLASQITDDRTGNYFLGLAVVGLLTIFGMFFCTGTEGFYARHPVATSWALSALVLVAGAFGVVAALVSSWAGDDARNYLGQLIADCKDWLEGHERSRKFFEVFRPSQEVVDGYLQGLALRLREVFEAESRFYDEGLKSLKAPTGDVMQRSDPEDTRETMQSWHRGELARIQKEVATAKAAFWDLRNLAKEQGYQVHSSWKEYVKSETDHDWRMP